MPSAEAECPSPQSLWSGESSGLAESAYQQRRRKPVPVGGRVTLQQERTVFLP